MMNDGIILVPSGDLSAYRDALDVGSAGLEVVTLPAPKTTRQTKKESLAVRSIKRENARELQKTIIALEATNIRRQFLCVAVFGILMTVVTLALVAAAFGTPAWRVYKVDERFNPTINPALFPCQKDSSVSTCQFTHSRRRGMFSTCYSKPGFLNKLYASSAFTLPYFHGEMCVWEQKYNIQGTPIVVKNNCGQDPSQPDASSLAFLNSNLMRAHWMCFAVAIAMLVVALILALISFACIRVLGLMLAALMVLIATLFLLGGMCLFHGYIHIEENLLTCPPFFAILKKDIYKDLYNNTLIRFGYSFWMGWISFCTGIVACSFLLGAACKRRKSMGIINSALDRMKDLNKDEKIDKKYEIIQEKIRRKEAENELKMEKKNFKRMSQMPMVSPRMIQGPIMDPRISDTQFNYRNINDEKAMMDNLALERFAMNDKYASFEEKSEKRLIKIEEKMRRELEIEKKKLEFEKKRVINAAKRGERKPKGRKRWLGKLGKSSDRRYRSDDSSSSSSDDGYCRRANSLEGRRDRCSMPQVPNGICNDPYTLHLPTGTNRY